MNEYDKLPLDDLCQSEVSDVEDENAIWKRRLGRCASAYRRGPGACRALASHLPAHTEQRVAALGCGENAGLSEHIHPDTPTRLIQWWVKLDGVKQRTAKDWARWTAEHNASLADLKREAGLKPPAPAPDPATVTCPVCGAVIDTSECKH